MKIPVLMYHSISEQDNKSSLSPYNFDKQMKFMKNMGFQTTHLKTLNYKKKQFVITFDDGYEDIFINALPILLKYDFQAICFFVTESIGKTNIWDSNLKNFNEMKIMDKKQIKSWSDNGMLIGSHTKNHANLKNLSYDEKYLQMSEPVNYFKDNFDINIEYFSYPFGSYDSKCLEISKDLYNYSFTTKRSRFNPSIHSTNEIPRVPINKKDGLFKFFLKTQTFYEDIKYK